jgi:hypothetical protein
MLYKIVYSTTYRHWLANEYEYSLKNYGHTHAQKFFTELDRKIQQFNDHPQWFCSKTMPKDTGYFFHGRSQKRGLGVYVSFLIDNDKKEVRILRIYGRSHLHELKQELAKTWRDRILKRKKN